MLSVVGVLLFFSRDLFHLFAFTGSFPLAGNMEGEGGDLMNILLPGQGSEDDRRRVVDGTTHISPTVGSQLIVVSSGGGKKYDNPLAVFLLLRTAHVLYVTTFKHLQKLI